VYLNTTAPLDYNTQEEEEVEVEENGGRELDHHRRQTMAWSQALDFASKTVAMDASPLLQERQSPTRAAGDMSPPLGFETASTSTPPLPPAAHEQLATPATPAEPNTGTDEVVVVHPLANVASPFPDGPTPTANTSLSAAPAAPAPAAILVVATETPPPTPSSGVVIASSTPGPTVVETSTPAAAAIVEAFAPTPAAVSVLFLAGCLLPAIFS
jgi:hypothetical protein